MKSSVIKSVSSFFLSRISNGYNIFIQPPYFQFLITLFIINIICMYVCQCVCANECMNIK